MLDDAPRTRTSGLGVWVWLMALIFCIAGIISIIRAPWPTAPSMPAPTAIVDPEVEKAAVLAKRAEERLHRAKFFDDHAQPAIAAADRANREAAERCVQRVRDQVGKYQKEIPPFIDDLTSWGTRFNIARQLPIDWWNNKNDVKELVTKKFETHFFSNDSLKQSIATSLEQFRADVDANNAKMLASIRASTSSADLPSLPELDPSEVSKELVHSWNEFLTSAGPESVTALFVTETASEAAGMAAGQLLVKLAGAGALGGPAGLAAGLVVGVFIDWWMTERFVTELTTRLNKIFVDIESAIIDGGGDKKGLRPSLNDSCDALREAYRQTMFRRLVEGPST